MYFVLGEAGKYRLINILAVGGSLKVSVYSKCLTMLLLSHMFMMVQDSGHVYASTILSGFPFWLSALQPLSFSLDEHMYSVYV